MKKALEKVVEENEDVARRVKGIGLMIGIELRTNPTKVIQLLQEKGILALKAGLTVLRFLPPYLINQEDVENLRMKLSEALNNIKISKQ